MERTNTNIPNNTDKKEVQGAPQKGQEGQKSGEGQADKSKSGQAAGTDGARKS